MKLLHGYTSYFLLGICVEVTVAASNCAVGNVNVGVKGVSCSFANKPIVSRPFIA
jgi:hypothetical protein